jgi:hypothetical protein
MENTETVRALSYWVKKIPKYVGAGKEFPSASQFVTLAIKTQIQKLEKKKKSFHVSTKVKRKL